MAFVVDLFLLNFEGFTMSFEFIYEDWVVGKIDQLVGILPHIVKLFLQTFGLGVPTSGRAVRMKRKNFIWQKMKRFSHR